MNDINQNYMSNRDQEIDKARHVVTTGRGLVEYEQRLQISRDELSGKYILDMGSGVAKFPEELCAYYKDKNNKPQVIALDIAYDFQKSWSRQGAAR